jgi:hypothetical protein
MEPSMTHTYTIISKQDTYVEWDRCGGYDGTHDGGFQQAWFTDRDMALDYLTDLQLKDKYVIPNEDNSYQYEHTLYIDGKSTSISWENLRDDNDEYERLYALEQEFQEDASKLFRTKEALFLAKQVEERLAKERKAQEAKEAQAREAALRKRESDLATLARLKEQYEGKGS